MKKILFFAISILIFGIARSQVFIDNTDATRTSSVSAGADRLSPYTQKVLYWNKDRHVILSQNASGRGVFTLTENGNTETAKSVTLSNYFNVKDFAIEGDTLYFCGSVNNNGSNVAFLAYIKIETLFKDYNIAPMDSVIIPDSSTHISPIISSGIKYTLINNAYQDSIFSIDRIEVFKDSTNNTTIAGIGKMYYGNPPYEKLQFDPYEGINSTFVDPSEYYLDFFMFYTIKEDTNINNYLDVVFQGDSATYGLSNDFEMFYIPSDTAESCYYNKFADITETPHKIYLTSINYSITGFYDPLNDAAYIDIYSFDKQTRQQHTGRLNLPHPVHQAYGVKTTHTFKDQIAIVYNNCYFPNNQYTCAFEVMHGDNNSFMTSKVSIFDTLEQRYKIYDCEYLENEQELIVLKKTLFEGQKEDFVFHLKMSDTTTFPYHYRKYKINYKDGYDLSYSDLNASNHSDYTVAGYMHDNQMLIYDTKNNSCFYNYPCYIYDKFQVSSLNPITVTSIPTLTQCKFYKPIKSVSDNQLTILHLSKSKLHVFIRYSLIPLKTNSDIKIHCLK